ncbi:hypothetical protein Dimus_017233 [Dionaea muscipula]
MVVRKVGINMLEDRHFARIDLLEIKALIRNKLGAAKADKYFQLLNRLFRWKVNKSEFDRLCVAVIGRENIRLHNNLILSIIKNACLSKTLPPKGRNPEDAPNGKVANGYQRSCLQSLCRDAFPPSPRRGRTPGFRDRRFKEKPSPLGPHGKPQTLALAGEDLAPKVQEQQQSATELLSLGSRPPLEVNSVEDGEEVNQTTLSPGIHSRSPVTAPFGIPINVKVPRKVLTCMSPSSSSSSVLLETCQRSSELPDTRSLMKRLEQKMEQEGLKVSSDCVNLLNNGVDVFLKRLIKPSLDLAASRVGSGTWQQNQVPQAVPGLNGNWPVRYSNDRQTQSTSVSLLDFRTAVALNPTILGQDWPIQLEKISEYYGS